MNDSLKEYGLAISGTVLAMIAILLGIVYMVYQGVSGADVPGWWAGLSEIQKCTAAICFFIWISAPSKS